MNLYASLLNARLCCRVPTPDNLQFRQSVQTLDATVYDIIGRRRAALAAARHDEEHIVRLLRADYIAPCLLGRAAQTCRLGMPASLLIFWCAWQEGCLLDALLRSEDEEGRRMSDSGIRDELMTLLIAGQACKFMILRICCSVRKRHDLSSPQTWAWLAQETSAILLGWCTAFLAHEPEVSS